MPGTIYTEVDTHITFNQESRTARGFYPTGLHHNYPKAIIRPYNITHRRLEFEFDNITKNQEIQEPILLVDSEVIDNSGKRNLDTAYLQEAGMNDQKLSVLHGQNGHYHNPSNYYEYLKTNNFLPVKNIFNSIQDDTKEFETSPTNTIKQQFIPLYSNIPFGYELSTSPYDVVINAQIDSKSLDEFQNALNRIERLLSPNSEMKISIKPIS